MDEALNGYILAFDEINTLMTTSYQTASRDDVQLRIVQIADDLLSFLINAYTKGTQIIAKMLSYDITVDIDEMYAAIYKSIDGKDFEDRVIGYVLADDLTGLQRLAESEYHRIYNTAMNDGARQYASKDLFKVEKTWHTLMDNKVRDTHYYLENLTVSLEDEFFTFDCDHAKFPGDFKKAENNVNCRCYLTYQTTV